MTVCNQSSNKQNLKTDSTFPPNLYNNYYEPGLLLRMQVQPTVQHATSKAPDAGRGSSGILMHGQWRAVQGPCRPRMKGAGGMQGTVLAVFEVLIGYS
ncbi:hypothetical protein N7510_006830 [Penicillium lagena]|uniref:uncharacterized protein n=1 Tax=Penicillium lagena TaxID=94218 RepID=UPI0025419274|nr:uncharacterized protein N7510_006830 [Penicillium lagena]KAJ5610111.1 hypothetical protein N7510_006830 [Penicillium lagena]